MKQVFFLAALFSATIVKAQNFTPVDDGSKIHFVIKNIGFNTGGDITGTTGKIVFDAKTPATASFDVSVKVSTLDTDNEKRDNHLKTADFFDADTYPTIHIVSTSVKKGADLKHFTFNGKLTIKNVTKNISFPFTAEGKTGGALFSGDFEIDRQDYKVGGESATLSDKVKVSLSVFAKAG